MITEKKEKDVPKGYKLTKIGVIPENWEIRNISSLTTLKGRIGWRGYTVEDLRDSGPLVIGATQIVENKLNFDNPTYLSIEKYLESPEIMVNKGDIILVKTGNTIGKVAFVENDIGKATINPNVALLKEIKINKKYLFYILVSDFFQKEIKKRITVGAQPSINQQMLKEILAPIPTDIEQSKIVSILSTWDKAIELKEKLIEQKKEQKKGLMQRLLTGEVRLPGFKGEWREVTLKNYIQQYSEKSTVRNQFPVLTSSRNGLMLQSDYYSNRQVTTDENVGYNIIPRGYITYRNRSDDGKFVFNKNTIIDYGIVSYFYPVFKFNDKVCGDFMLELLNHTIERKAYSFVEGTAQKVLSLKKLGTFKYFIPNIEEQKAIAKVLMKININIELLEEELNQLKKQKKGLMKLLLTGKIRVPV